LYPNAMPVLANQGDFIEATVSGTPLRSE